MSTFYKSLTTNEKWKFGKRKRKFKEGKPCAICGRRLAPKRMMVAHIKPVRELPRREALMNAGNWEVRCIACERRLNREEQLRNNELRKEKKPKKPPKEVISSTKSGEERQRQRQRKKILDMAMEQDVITRFKTDQQARRSKSRGKRRRDDYYAE